MTGECASVLKQRSISRVRIDDELGIGQMFAESERVDGGDHRVVAPIGDKYRLLDLLHVSEAFAYGPGPGSHCCQLGSRRLCRSWTVLIFCSAVPAVAQTGAPPLD